MGKDTRTREQLISLLSTAMAFKPQCGEIGPVNFHDGPEDWTISLPRPLIINPECEPELIDAARRLAEEFDLTG